MRCLLPVLLVLLCALGVSAQDEEGDSGLVRAYHFDRSGMTAGELCDTSIGCPTLGVLFDNEVAGTYAPEIGSSYVMTVNGNPTRVASGTHPTGLDSTGYAWRMDGTGDYLSLADDPAFEVADFSVFVCFVPRAVASGDAMISKWSADRSWEVFSTGTDVGFAISDDGSSGAGHLSTLIKATSIATNRLTCLTASYDYTTDANSIGNIWVDELAVANAVNMDGPPFTGTAPFDIGAYGAGLSDISADFYVAAYYPGVLTAADHAKLNRRFRGLYDSSLSNVVAVTAATMPAIQLAWPASGVTPFLVDQPANSNMIGAVASGSGGLYGSSAIVNKCWRASFASDLTGWTEATTSDGNCDSATVAPVHGSKTAICTTTDADDAVTITSGCATVTGGTAMWLSAWLKTASGTGLVDVNIIEDDSADCATPTTTTAVVNDAVPGADWARYSGAITLQAGTIRAQVQISLPAAAAQTTYIDAVTFRAGIATDAFCSADTDADASCSTMVQSTADNGSLISANGSSSIVGTFRSPWAGTDVTATTTLITDGNYGAANTLACSIITTTDETYFSITDATPAAKTISPNVLNWASGTDYVLKIRRDGLGGMGLWWNAAWTTTTAGAGTGKRSGSQALFYICGSQTVGSDVWARSVEFYRRMVQ